MTKRLLLVGRPETSSLRWICAADLQGGVKIDKISKPARYESERRYEVREVRVLIILQR
jgi:hypothetical protein